VEYRFNTEIDLWSLLDSMPMIRRGSRHHVDNRLNTEIDPWSRLDSIPIIRRGSRHHAAIMILIRFLQ
ncbi:MAG: hypothetical protein ACI90V_009974, partial [Bacillariaceae sp.]